MIDHEAVSITDSVGVLDEILQDWQESLTILVIQMIAARVLPLEVT